MLRFGAGQPLGRGREPPPVVVGGGAEEGAGGVGLLVGHGQHHPAVVAGRELLLHLRRGNDGGAVGALHRAAGHRALLGVVGRRPGPFQNLHGQRLVGLRPQPVGDGAAVFAVAQPALADEGDFGAADGVGATHRLGPDIGDDGMPIRILIERRQARPDPIQHPAAPLIHGAHQVAGARRRTLQGKGVFLAWGQGELRPGEAHRVIDRGQQRQYGVGVQVQRVGLAAQPGGLQRQTAAAAEGIEHARRAAVVGVADALLHLGDPLRLLPGGLVGQRVDDELQQGVALGFRLRRADQRGERGGAAGGQRPAGEPGVDGVDVALGDGFGAFDADLGQGQQLLDQALGWLFTAHRSLSSSAAARHVVAL